VGGANFGAIHLIQRNKIQSSTQFQFSYKHRSR